MSPRRSKRTVSTWLKCVRCAHQAANESALTQHMHSVHPDEIKKCDYCDQAFLKSEIKSHVFTKHSEGPMAAGRPQRNRKPPVRMIDANVGFISSTKRRKTSMNKSDSKFGTSTLSTVRERQEAVPKETDLKVVEGKVDSRSDERGSEKDSQQVEKPECPVCFIRMESFQSLSNHMLIHVSPKSKFACKHCSGEFENQEDFLKHKIVHAENRDERVVVVSKAGIVVGTDLSMEERPVNGDGHLNNGGAEKTGRRDRLPETTPSGLKMPSIIEKKSTRSHRLSEVNSNKRPKEVMCIYCQEVFRSLVLLNEHREAVHAQPPLQSFGRGFRVFPYRKKSEKTAINSAQTTERKGQLFCCTVCYEGPFGLVEMNEHRALIHDMPALDLNVKIGVGVHVTDNSRSDLINDNGENELDESGEPDVRETLPVEMEDQGEGDAEVNSETIPDANIAFKRDSVSNEISGASCSDDIAAENSVEQTCFQNIAGLSAKQIETVSDVIDKAGIDGEQDGTVMQEEEGDDEEEEEFDLVQRRSYACTQCDLHFLSEHTLLAHCRHHTAAAYRCTVCKTDFKTKSALEQHQKEHPNLRYFCEHCGLILWTESGLKQHTVRMHGLDTDREFICPECDRKFDDTLCLRKHIDSVHKYKDRFQCELCDKKFSFRARLRDHMRIHTGEAKYQCGVCERQFIHDNTFRNHVKKHRGEMPSYSKSKKICAPSLCDTCGKCFPTPQALRLHERVHQDRQLKCNYCPKKFKNELYWKNHMKLHTTLPNLQCTYCAKKFRTSTTLQEHMVSHTGETPFQCQICGFATGTLNRLRKHEKARHLDVKYTCPECSLQLTTFQGLLRHYLHHTREFPYNCSYCHKLFYLEANARRHVDFHMKKGLDAAVVDNLTTEYTCKECGKKLRTFANLVIHLHLTHKFTREQFPELPRILQENSGLVQPDEEDTELYTLAEKAERGKILLHRPEQRTSADMNDIVEVPMPFVQIVEQPEHESQDFPVAIVSADGTMDMTSVTLPANFDKDTLALAVSQLMAMQASKEAGEVTLASD